MNCDTMAKMTKRSGIGLASWFSSFNFQMTCLGAMKDKYLSRYGLADRFKLSQKAGLSHSSGKNPSSLSCHSELRPVYYPSWLVGKSC